MYNTEMHTAKDTKRQCYVKNRLEFSASPFTLLISRILLDLKPTEEIIYRLCLLRSYIILNEFIARSIVLCLQLTVIGL